MLETLPTRPSATAAAEQALRDAIMSGELAPGDRLPPERVLSKRLGVSRLTLRAALATLSAAGLVSVRHGSGYTVRDVRETGGTDLLPGLVEGMAGRDSTAASRGALAGDLLRLRRHLAAAVLEAIAERPPSAAARKAVHRAVERFADATATLHACRAATGDGGVADASDPRHGVDAHRRDDDRPGRGAFPDSARTAREGRIASLRAAELAIVDADLGVVRALLDATDSMILRVCLNPIIAVLRDSAPLRAAIYAQPETNLVGWRALLVWLEAPDVSAIPVLLGVLAERDRATVASLRKAKGSA